MGSGGDGLPGERSANLADGFSIPRKYGNTDPLPIQKHILISDLISVFSDLEIHQQIIELHRKENQIMQKKLLKLAEMFGISDIIIHTLQYQKEQNLSKISFLYSRLESFFQREKYFHSLIKKVNGLKELLANLQNAEVQDCSTGSIFSNVNTNFSMSQVVPEETRRHEQISNELVATLRLATHQITDDVFFYTHDVVNYIKNMEFSNSQVYKNLNIFKKDLQKIGNARFSFKIGSIFKTF